MAGCMYSIGMVALRDGNNFYVSCERVFRPSLHGRPIVVLYNNDGCAIARSNEARALGIRMGTPFHEIRDRLPDAGVVALSANFTLYGDMSNRLKFSQQPLRTDANQTAESGPHRERLSPDRNQR